MQNDLNWQHGREDFVDCQLLTCSNLSDDLVDFKKWMDHFGFYVLFCNISFKSGGWESDNKRLGYGNHFMVRKSSMLVDLCFQPLDLNTS